MPCPHIHVELAALPPLVAFVFWGGVCFDEEFHGAAEAWGDGGGDGRARDGGGHQALEVGGHGVGAAGEVVVLVVLVAQAECLLVACDVLGHHIERVQVLQFLLEGLREHLDLPRGALLGVGADERADALEPCDVPPLRIEDVLGHVADAVVDGEGLELGLVGLECACLALVDAGLAEGLVDE